MRNVKLPVNILLISFVLTINLSCKMNRDDVKSDLDKLCSLAESINGDSSISLSKRSNEFINRANQTDLSNKTKKFLHDLSIKSIADYNDFVLFSKKNGIENFQCESIKMIMSH